MMRTARSTALLLVAACTAEATGSLTIAGPDTARGVDTAAPGDTSRPTDTDGDTGSIGACGNPIVSSTPVDGATGVSLGTRVDVQLTEAEPTATVRLRTDGRDVPGTSESLLDGTVHRFSLLGPLAADAVHETRLTWSCGTEIIPWRTAAPAMRWPLASGRLLQPDTDLALRTVLPSLVVGIAALGGGELDLVVATGPTLPDPCVPSFAMSGSVDAASDVDVSAIRGVFAVGEALAGLSDVRVRGTLDATASRLRNVDMGFVLDARDVAPALGKDPEDVCAAVGGCSRCPDNTARCFAVRVDMVPVVPVTGPVALRTASDINQDPTCD